MEPGRARGRRATLRGRRRRSHRALRPPRPGLGAAGVPAGGGGELHARPGGGHLPPGAGWAGRPRRLRGAAAGTGRSVGPLPAARGRRAVPLRSDGTHLSRLARRVPSAGVGGPRAVGAPPGTGVRRAGGDPRCRGLGTAGRSRARGGAPPRRGGGPARRRAGGAGVGPCRRGAASGGAEAPCRCRPSRARGRPRRRGRLAPRATDFPARPGTGRHAQLPRADHRPRVRRPARGRAWRRGTDQHLHRPGVPRPLQPDAGADPHPAHRAARPHGRPRGRAAHQRSGHHREDGSPAGVGRPRR